MADGLKIQVGADVKPAIDAFRDLEAQAKRSATAAGQSFGTGVTKGATALKSFTTSSNTATQSLVNLGRVVQDAPFGFIGIANNLNPLLESFQRLKATTGTTGGALKALGKELSGAGGIGFALSLASTAAIVFGDQLFGAGKAAEAAKSAADKLKESVNGIFSSVAKEATEVGSLVTVLRSETETRERKLGAIKELQRIAPQTFQDLKLEGNAVQGLDAAYTSYLDNLKKVIAAKIIQARLEQKIEELLRLQGVAATKSQQQLIDATNNFVNKQRKIVDQDGRKLYEKFYDGIERKGKDTIKTLESDIQGLFDDLRQFSSQITVPVTAAPKITFTKPVSLDFRQFDFGEIQIPPEDVKPIATEFGVMFSKELNDYFKNNGLFDPSIAAAQTLEKQQKAILGIFGVQAKADSPFTQIQREAIFAAQTIQQVLTPAFQGLFDAIVAGENPLKAFFSGLGQAVAQLIQKLISAAITAAILSAIFPGGLGGVQGFGGFFKGLVGFASGGIVSGPTLALVGEGAGTSRSNPEVIAPLDQLRSMIADMGGGGSQRVVVTGRLRGNDMVLQNARTSRYQQRTTGR